MTKKDYVMIAEVFKLEIADIDDARDMGYIDETLQGELAQKVFTLAESLAIRLAQANAAFDRERFLKACGVTL